MNQEFSIKHIILAVFHKATVTKDSFNLALAINKRMGAIFNASPIMIPGDNTPSEIPRVIFKSEKGININVSQIVTNIQIDVLEENSPENILSGFLATGNEVISLVDEDFECGIARIGVLLIGELAIKTNGADFIKENYLKGYDEPVFASEVHWLTHPTISDEKINRWVRIKSDVNGMVSESLEITIDCNIIHEEERIVSGEFARNYLKTCVEDIHDNFEVIVKID